MKTYKEITDQFLYNEYIVNKKSMREIAKETGLTKKQIQRLIHKFNIETRIGKPSKKLKYKDILTKDFLYDKYIDEGESIREISAYTHIHANQISKYLDLYNIPKRTCGTRKGKKNKNSFKYKQDINIGHTYGYLTVIGIDKNKLECKCNCGNVKTLHTSRIRNQQVKSCGCLSYRRGVKNPL